MALIFTNDQNGAPAEPIVRADGNFPAKEDVFAFLLAQANQAASALPASPVQPNSIAEQIRSQMQAAHGRKRLVEFAQAFVAADFGRKDDESPRDWADRVDCLVEDLQDLATEALTEAGEPHSVPAVGELTEALEEAMAIIATMNQLKPLDEGGAATLAALEHWLCAARRKRK
jgi:hypothetical protein